MGKTWQSKAIILSLMGAMAWVWVTITATVSYAQDEIIDWSVKLCDSVLARYTPNTFGSWQYPQGLFLEGMWRVYQRTGNTQYYNFIKSWVDRFVTGSGLGSTISLDSLDNMMPGVLLCHLYEATNDNKYKTAAQQIRNRLNTYPGTTDGGLVHNTSLGDELWLDGAFMLTDFLINYAYVFNDDWSYNESSTQLIIYNNHLKYPATKLAWHAWDENGSASWANPTTHLSPEVWCRALGWYVVACTEVLEKLPMDHPDRQAVIDILAERLEGIKNYQDSTTGLWYDVVDKGDLPDNWVEESGGCMYTYALSKAIDAGFVSADDYDPTARKGYEGILSNIALDQTGKTNLYGTCEGTGAGSPYSYYINRSQVTNDNHGQGAFLFANEQLRTKYSGLRLLFQAESGVLFHAATETTNRGFTGASYVNLDNEVGSYLRITADATAAGTKNLVVRYANGDTVDRPMRISLNGVVVSDSTSFVPTGAWTAWRSQSLPITLEPGQSTIELSSLTSTGGPNIDWVALDSGSTQIPSQCIGDLEPDGDVDGLDLAGVIETFDPGFDLARFASEFGRIDCF
jgi:unsaturated rhamnogalacturonyl hydrolase